MYLQIADLRLNKQGSAIVGAFGYGKSQTALIGMSTGASEIVAIFIGVVIARLSKTRVIPGVFSFLVAIIGGVL